MSPHVQDCMNVCVCVYVSLTACLEALRVKARLEKWLRAPTHEERGKADVHTWQDQYVEICCHVLSLNK